jgi:hypothetical protein
MGEPVPAEPPNNPPNTFPRRLICFLHPSKWNATAARSFLLSWRPHRFVRRPDSGNESVAEMWQDTPPSRQGSNSVGFFSLVWGLKLTDDEKQNLVTYMLTL